MKNLIVSMMRSQIHSFALKRTNCLLNIMYTKSVYNKHAILLKLILNGLHILSYVFYVTNILTQSHIIINHMCEQIVFFLFNPTTHGLIHV